MPHAATAIDEGITEMPLPQENFETAVRSADDTFDILLKVPDLGRQPTPALRKWLWDLEAISAALRLELMNRETQHPIDLG